MNLSPKGKQIISFKGRGHLGNTVRARLHAILIFLTPEYHLSIPGFQRTLSYVLRISTIIISICGILDVLFIAYIFGFKTETFLDAYPAKPLQTLSTYINFDELYAKKSYITRHPPLLNRPRNYFQVSSEDRDKSFPYWFSVGLQVQGYFLYEDYRLLVTPKV